MPDLPREAELAWEGDVPVARAFDDPYFSRASGVAETEHVFLAGNGLPGRWAGRDRFVIAELGFGTGLNAFLTALKFREHNSAGTLEYVSFEMFPMAPEDMVRALQPYPQLGAVMAECGMSLSLSRGINRFRAAGLDLQVIVGDANSQVPLWTGQADAWFLDGFAPAKNPDLWGEALMAAVFAKTAPGGTFATYTAAGWVRRNLQAGGFEVEKMKGFGSKRDMLRGRKTQTPLNFRSS